MKHTHPHHTRTPPDHSVSIGLPIGKNNFPNLFARAHIKYFSERHIASSFRTTGIWPYNPLLILDKLFLPEPIIASSNELEAAFKDPS